MSIKLLFAYCPNKWILAGNVVAVFFAAIQGAAWPLFAVLFGNLINAAGNNTANIRSQTDQIALHMLLVGIGVIFSGAVWNSILGQTAKYRSFALNKNLFAAILHKPMAWFDTREDSVSLFSENVVQFEKAIGPKLGLFVMNASQAMFGIGIGFAYGWQMPLVVIAALPMIALSTMGLSHSIGRATSQSNAAYSSANAICSESIFCLKTVTAFNAQPFQARKYRSELERGLSTIRTISIKLGLNFGFSISSVFFLFAIAFAFGGYLISHNIGNYTSGSVVTVLIAILTGAFGLGQTSISTQAFAEGLAGLAKIRTILEEKQSLLTDSGPAFCGGENLIDFENVSFGYSVDSPIFTNVSLHVAAGESIAIVGPSGSGKSSIISLMLRYYHADSGNVFVCGRRIQTVADLRTLIGYVGQEPVLFAASVRENLLFGLSRAVDDFEIQTTLLSVNAWDFVASLPQGLDTLCGPAAGLSRLSGGQKQRIAIARALLRNPRILLLDEATSALDNESERTVLAAVAAVRRHRPELATVAVAHRLSTISGVDRIYVLDKKGLILNKGEYAAKVIEKINVTEEHFTEAKVSSFAQNIDLLKQTKPVGTKASSAIGKLAQIALIPTEDRWYYLFGTLGAIIKGFALPIDAFIFSAVSGYLFLTDPAELMHSVGMGSVAYVGLGVVAFTATFVDLTCFSILKETVMVRLRIVLFQHFVSDVPIEYFDSPKNPPQLVTQRIADWATQSASLLSVLPRICIEVCAAFVGGCIVSFLASPLLAGVVVATFPIVLVASGISAASYMGVDEEKPTQDTLAPQTLSATTTIVAETIANMRTVRALNGEPVQLEKFTRCAESAVLRTRKPAIMAGVAFGVSMGTMFLAYALGYYVGGILVAKGQITVTQMSQAILGPMLTSLAIGEALAFLPDIGQSLDSANKLLNELVEPKIVSLPSDSHVSIRNIALENVVFSYPQNAGLRVLNGLSLCINGGHKLALVGESGGGKSTVFALLLRFYEPQSGRISVNDGRNLFDEKWFRSRIGYVAQEPVLFNMSLRENVMYGLDSCDEEQFQRVAEQACIDWVDKPEAWNLPVGDRGSRLSGGQKQRVAIARALIRNPDVFLIDEGTSALDSNCEARIQATFDRLVANEQKAIVVIAHRLSTVENSDTIAVIQSGQVAQTGSHTQLIQITNGVYARLYYNGLA